MSAIDEVATAVLRVSADGADWRDVSPPLQSVDVEDHDRLTDKATVVLDDDTGLLAHASFEGLRVRVALGWHQEQRTIFEGDVTSSRVFAHPGGQRIELTALDFTNRMALRPFEPMEWQPGERLSEVLKRIVQRADYHLTPGQIEPANDLVQDERRPARSANVNEWEFVLQQAQRQGCLAFAEFDGVDTSKFSFVPIAVVASAKPIGTLRYCRGVGELIEFEYERISSGALPVRAADSIDPTTGKPVTAPAPTPPPRPELPPPSTARHKDLGESRRASLEALTELAAAASTALRQPTERISGEAAGTEAETADRVTVDPTRVLGLNGHGVATGNVLLRAKSVVRISGVAPWAEGDWYLTKVNHVYTRERANNRTRSSYFTKFTATR